MDSGPIEEDPKFKKCDDTVKEHYSSEVYIQTENDQEGVLQYYFVLDESIEVDGRFWLKRGDLSCFMNAPG